jgi:hypothetical protein
MEFFGKTPNTGNAKRGGADPHPGNSPAARHGGAFYS